MTAYKDGDPTTLSRLYGRSVGKPLRARQQALVDDLLPKLAVPDEGPITAERLFGEDCPLHFEIGFGGGEHLSYRADLLPNHGFIGAEPFLNGVAQALTHVEEQRLANIRLHAGDALEVLSRVPDGALTMVYLLHPDPWPKARHAKRRMMNDGPVRMIGAGTLSQRLRSTPPSFNELRWDGETLRVHIRNLENIDDEAMKIDDVPEDAHPPREEGEPVAPVGAVPRTDPPVS